MPTPEKTVKRLLPVAEEIILSCPFCGSTQVEICRTNKNACWVRCARLGCGADAKSHPDRKGAIKNWNRRFAPAVAKIASDDEEDRKDRLHA